MQAGFLQGGGQLGAPCVGLAVCGGEQRLQLGEGCLPLVAQPRNFAKARGERQAGLQGLPCRLYLS